MSEQQAQAIVTSHADGPSIEGNEMDDLERSMYETQLYDARKQANEMAGHAARLQKELLEAQTKLIHLRQIADAVALLEARESVDNPLGRRDVVLCSEDINVLWIREQARKVREWEAK